MPQAGLRTGRKGGGLAPQIPSLGHREKEEEG